MTETERMEIDGLATIQIDDGVVTIWLDKKLDGTVDFTSSDINYFLKNWKPGDVYYRSIEDTPESFRRIAVLLEELSGHPNGALALSQLRETLPKDHWHLHDFVRPKDTGSARFCSWLLPSATKKKQTHVVYNFGNLRRYFCWWHYASAIPMLAFFIGLIYLQTHFMPWMIYSPLTGTIELGKKTSMVAAIAGLVLLVVIDNKLGTWQKSTGYSPFTNKAAIYEEQAFREGAEDWRTWERFRSCLSFGLFHLPSLYYVFGMFLPHVIMGSVFMAIYLRTFRRTNCRRTAVLAASVFHVVYNRVTLIVIALVVLFELALPVLF
ncbi:hypothetical protein [Shimazuella kribbensis]|uniref:hypothetical protein n=1 Tax=Shimazuella kribbensis TaxID=139808 RepID=UPI000402E99D|nr:hypothetical protein [Shimazuella kribbensis]